MKKTFFKFGLFLALGITTAVFYSCSKDDTGDGSPVSSITATNVVNSSSNIATIKAELYWETDTDYGFDVIAEAPYQNNGFTLRLPATVAAKYLSSIMDDGGMNMDLTGITVSDKTAMATFVYEIDAYDKNGDNAGFFAYSSVDPSVYSENFSSATWLYVDRNVTINGQYNYVDAENNQEYNGTYNNVTLKKGWNIIYSTETYSQNQLTGKEKYTFIISNQKPSGVTLKWYFYDYNSSTYGASLKSTKSLSKNNLFSKIKRR